MHLGSSPRQGAAPLAGGDNREDRLNKAAMAGAMLAIAVLSGCDDPHRNDTCADWDTQYITTQVYDGTVNGVPHYHPLIIPQQVCLRWVPKGTQGVSN